MAKTVASKILANILEVCEIKDQKGDEKRQDFLFRCFKSVNELSDKDWEDLSDDAQSWANGNADLVEKDKNATLNDFPDLPKEEPAPAASSRRRKASDEDDGGGVKVGRTVTVISKRGRETVGEVVEYEAEKLIVVKKADGEEVEFDFDMIGSIEVKNDGVKAPEPEQARDPQKGDKIEFTTKRGRKVAGVLVELTKDEVVVKTADGEEEFRLDRIEGDIMVAGAAAVPAAEAPKSSRRGASSEKADVEPKPDDKEKRVVPKKGQVSVGQAVKEEMAADPDCSLKDLMARLTKREIEFKEVTVEMNHTECAKFIAELRKAKKLK